MNLEARIQNCSSIVPHFLLGALRLRRSVGSVRPCVVGARSVVVGGALTSHESIFGTLRLGAIQYFHTLIEPWFLGRTRGQDSRALFCCERLMVLALRETVVSQTANVSLQRVW